MQRIESPAEVLAAVARAKAGAPAYVSNFFPATGTLERWIARSRLFRVSGGPSSALFLRRDQGLWHLYFAAAGAEALALALGDVPEIEGLPVVTDLVGREPDIRAVEEALGGVGLRLHRELFRMARVGAREECSPGGATSTVEGAVRSDGPAMLALLRDAFDPRSEQIPAADEVDLAIDRGQVLVVRHCHRLAGLLHFETVGFSSLLRYWLVANSDRGRGVGGELMRRYFDVHPTVRRFLLWVVASNASAIDKYRHYGYRADGLVDHVLANERARR